MAEKSGQISLGELCRSLADEFAVALVTVKRSHPHVTVNSVKFNIGQTSRNPDDTNDIEGTAPFISRDRYPGSEAGWQLQLDLGEKPAATFEGVKRPLVSRTAPTALDIVAWEPVTVIDGISTGWGRFFAGFEIYQIIDLARVEEPLLQKMVAESNNLLVREFRQKALLLQLPVPSLPVCLLGERSLHDILKLSMTEVEKSFSRRVTHNEVAALFEVLDIFNVVIDNRMLRKISLRQLLGS